MIWSVCSLVFFGILYPSQATTIGVATGSTFMKKCSVDCKTSINHLYYWLGATVVAEGSVAVGVTVAVVETAVAGATVVS